MKCDGFSSYVVLCVDLCGSLAATPQDVSAVWQRVSSLWSTCSDGRFLLDTQRSRVFDVELRTLGFYYIHTHIHTAHPYQVFYAINFSHMHAPTQPPPLVFTQLVCDHIATLAHMAIASMHQGIQTATRVVHSNLHQPVRP